MHGVSFGCLVSIESSLSALELFLNVKMGINRVNFELEGLENKGWKGRFCAFLL